jgi:hypothetical protein
MVNWLRLGEKAESLQLRGAAASIPVEIVGREHGLNSRGTKVPKSMVAIPSFSNNKFDQAGPRILHDMHLQDAENTRDCL